MALGFYGVDESACRVDCDEERVRRSLTAEELTTATTVTGCWAVAGAARSRDEDEATRAPLSAAAPYRPVTLGVRPTPSRIACNNGCAMPPAVLHRVYTTHGTTRHKVHLRERKLHFTRNAQRVACSLLEGHSPRPA